MPLPDFAPWTGIQHESSSTNCRDTIAQQMWDYQQVLLDRAGDEDMADEFMEEDHEDVSDYDEEDIISLIQVM